MYTFALALETLIYFVAVGPIVPWIIISLDDWLTHSRMSLATSRWTSCCSHVRSFGTIVCMFKSYIRITCTELYAIHTSFLISRVIIWWFSTTRLFTFSSFWGFLLVQGLMEFLLLSTDVCPCLRQWYHSLLCVSPILSLLETFLIFFMVSACMWLSFW